MSIDGSPPGSRQPASPIIDSQFITVLELNLDVFRKGKLYFSVFCSIKKEKDVYSIFSGKKKNPQIVSTVENKTIYLHSKWLLESET